MQPPKPKPKPALKKTAQNFGAYKVPIRAKPDRPAAPEPDRSAASSPVPPLNPRRISNRVSQQGDQLSDRDSSPDVPASRRTFRSTSSKGSRQRRSVPAPNSDSDASLAVASRATSAATSVASSAGSLVPDHRTDENRESTAESILGLWDVNRAQEKTAEKEIVRERRHRASQEGVREAEPEPPSVDALLHQHLSMSKWKGAVKAVNAVNKMGYLVRNRPPSAPAVVKRGRSSGTQPGDHWPGTNFVLMLPNKLLIPFSAGHVHATLQYRVHPTINVPKQMPSAA